MPATILLTCFLGATKPTHAFPSAEVVVSQFFRLYMKQDDFGLLQGKRGPALVPFLSRGLLRKIAELRACQDDFIKHHPDEPSPNGGPPVIYKPPYVDCCLFSGVPDGPPNRFAVVSSPDYS